MNYFRREFHDISYTEQSLDSVVGATRRSRFPDPRNNGETITVYNVNPAALSAPTNELDTTSANNTTTFNGFDVGHERRGSPTVRSSPAGHRPAARSRSRAT